MLLFPLIQQDLILVLEDINLGACCAYTKFSIHGREEDMTNRQTILSARLGKTQAKGDWIKQKYTNSNSCFLCVNGKNVHYRDEGVGEVIVLLHGTASSLHTWDEWVVGLTGKFRVIRLDLPGCGLTGHDASNRYEVQDDVTLLAAFLQSLAVEKAHFVGSSLGGRIAWEYSLYHPDTVLSLTLMNALGYPQQTWPPAIKLAKLPLLDRLMEYCLPKFIYRKSLTEVYADPQLITQALVDRYYELSLYHNNRKAFPLRVKVALDTDSYKIKEITAPTLILWGKEDMYFPVENAYRFNQDIPYSTAKVYEQVGHLPMEEIPAQSLNDFILFLYQIPKMKRSKW